MILLFNIQYRNFSTLNSNIEMYTVSVPELPLSKIVNRRPETVFNALIGMSSAWIPAEITKHRNKLKVARRIRTVG